MSRRRKIRILLIILIIIFILIVGLIIGLNTKNNKKQNYVFYGSIDKVDSLENLINQIYGELLKVTDSTEKNYYKDIYVNIKYDLYENGESKQEFYSDMISNVANKMYYESFRIIDENKNIEIKVISDKEKVLGSLINGDTDFYGHYESQKNLSNYKEISVVNFEIASNEILTLVNNEWIKNSLFLGECDSKFENYEEYAEQGLSIYTIQNKVFNMIFDERYTENVISTIKVGQSYEEIIAKLGTPTFGSIEENYIGYKGKECYVFFTENEISVYRNESNYDTKDFVNILKKYSEGENIKTTISNITDLWMDYEDYYYDEYSIELRYPLRGIKIQLGNGYPQGIIIYNNYVGKIVDNYTQDVLKSVEVEIPNFIYFEAKDLINEYEIERINSSILSDDEEYIEVE